MGDYLSPSQQMQYIQARGIASETCKEVFSLFGSKPALQQALREIADNRYLGAADVPAVTHHWGRKMMVAADEMPIPRDNHAARHDCLELKRGLYRAAESMLEAHPTQPKLITDLLDECRRAKVAVGHKQPKPSHDQPSLI